MVCWLRILGTTKRHMLRAEPMKFGEFVIVSSI